MESKIKHLEFLQLTITRMAANSFILKGWSVTLISALALLSQKDTNPRFWVIAMLPALIFWGLDGYFLRQEFLFRKLYDIVRAKPEDEIDFSMSTQEFQHKVGRFWAFVFSPTLLAFHGAILAGVVIVAVFVNSK